MILEDARCWVVEPSNLGETASLERGRNVERETREMEEEEKRVATRNDEEKEEGR